jgi:hypothetical protein
LEDQATGKSDNGPALKQMMADARPGFTPATFPTGFRIMKDGNLTCKIANFAPKFQSGVLRSILFTCPGAPEVSGTYDCSDTLVCKKGPLSLELYDDSIQFQRDGNESWFTLSVVIIPEFSLSFFKDDGRCDEPNRTMQAQVYRGQTFLPAEFQAFCNTTVPAASDQIWGYKINNFCKDISDRLANESKLVCNEVLLPFVEAELKRIAQGK